MRHAFAICLLVTVSSTLLPADELNFPAPPSPPEIPVLTKPSGSQPIPLPRATSSATPKIVKPSLDPSKMVLPSASKILPGASPSKIKMSDAPVNVTPRNHTNLAPGTNQLDLRPTVSQTPNATQFPPQNRRDIEPAFSRTPRSVPPAPRSPTNPITQRSSEFRGTLPPAPNPASLRNQNSSAIPLLESVLPPVGSGLAEPNAANTFVDPSTAAGDQFIDVLKTIEREQHTNKTQGGHTIGRLKVDRAPFAVFVSEANEPVQQDSEVPQLRVSTIGPNTLVVGRSSRYTISLNNLGEFDATDVQVRCSIPEWVNLDESQTSGGRVSVQSKDVTWDVDLVSAGASQKLVLDLTPRAGKAFELNVDIAVQPSQTKKQISIQEPKLSVKMTGPSDAIYNQPAIWQIEVTNPGTGDARDVTLDIYAGQEKLDSQSVGVIPAGETRNAILEVTSTEAGPKNLRALVSGNPDITDQTSADFVCRRGRVSLAMSGPEVQYAGSKSVYELTVRNPGDAELRNVLLNLNLPQGVTYGSGLLSPNVTAGGVSWFADRLAPGATKEFQVQLNLGEGGTHEIKALATTADDLTATAATSTESRTAADLKLVVTDPVGPQSIGSVTDYVIEVSNRGTAAAREIEIIAVCAPELEPIDVDGNAAIQSGQIFFKPLADLPSDHKVTYTVRARAKKPGTHAFRVIVKSYRPDLRLATEEQTQFYDRNNAPTETAPEEQQDSNSEEEMASRTVELISKGNRKERSY